MTNTKFVAKHALILFLIAFLCSLILILCNNLTKDRIAKLQEQTELAAQSEVLPEAKTFEKANEAMLISDSTVREVLAGKDADGKEVGYCVKIEPSGFGGTISMTVGIGNDFTVKGVKITSMSETPGLGAKADENWLKQFNGKKDGIEVVKTGNASDSQINAISGATITSKAVTGGVNSALSAVKIVSKARADKNE